MLRPLLSLFTACCRLAASSSCAVAPNQPLKVRAVPHCHKVRSGFLVLAPAPAGCPQGTTLGNPRRL